MNALNGEQLYLAKYLQPADHNPRRIPKTIKDFSKTLGFKDIQFPFKIETLTKLKKSIKNKNSMSVFGLNKEKYPIYVLKECCEDKHVDLLSIGEEGKRHYVLIKDFNTFIYSHTLCCGRKKFCCYCLQDFVT